MNAEERKNVCYDISVDPTGEKFLKILSDFCLEHSPVKGEDVYSTYYNIGKRDVILYIRNLKKQKKEGI